MSWGRSSLWSDLLVRSIESRQPGRQALDRDLEVRIFVHELAHVFREPGERDGLVTAAVGKFFDTSIGEVHRYAKACSMIRCCSCSWREWVPAAGEDDDGLDTHVMGRPRTEGVLIAMNDHAP